VLTFSTTVEEYDSNLDGFDRKVVTTAFDLNLGEAFF
jgi:hypothetical protein